MKLTYSLIISSILIPLSTDADNWAKRLKEKLHFSPKDNTRIQQAVLEVQPFQSLKALIENASDSEMNAANDDGWNAAHMAAALGLRNVLQLLYEKKKNIILKENKAGHKAIHVAAICGEADVVKFLVKEADVDVDIKSQKKKMTSLQLAAESGCVGAIKALVELKADIDACDTKEGVLTPLAYAVAGGHFLATEILLQLGADKEKRISFNESVPYSTMRPLPIAVRTLNVEIVELLLTQNADTMYGHFTIVHYLSDAPPVGDGGKKVEAVLDKLIEKPVRQNGVNTGKPTHRYLGGERNIIRYTISRKNYEMFHVLIRKINEELRPGNGKRIWTELLDDKDERGNNALSMAVENWDTEMTYALMRTEGIRVGASNFCMEAQKAERILMWFKANGSPILAWMRENFKRPQKFSTFCETLFKKYEETWVPKGRRPERTAANLSSFFPLYKSRNFYPFYLALQSYYSEYIISHSEYGEGKENKELAKKLSKNYRKHREKKREYLLGNEEDRIKYLISSKENEYMMEVRIIFANLLKEIYVWRPELEEDALILAHLKTKFVFNCDDVRALFSEDPKKLY